MSKRKNGVRASVRALSSSVAGSTAADAHGTRGEAPLVDDGGSDVEACQVRGAGFHDDHLHGPDARVYRRTSAHIKPNRAQELLRSGAAMAVDDCGCGGYCGLELAVTARTRRARTAAPEAGQEPARMAR